MGRRSAKKRRYRADEKLSADDKVVCRVQPGSWLGLRRAVLHPVSVESPRRSRFRGWRLAIGAVLLAAGAAAAGVAGMLLYYSASFPDPMPLRLKEPSPVIRILARDGSLLAERGDAHDYMPLDLLPRHVTDAVVATEDRRFYRPPGRRPARPAARGVRQPARAAATCRAARR